jgi:SAM-dependent methyltransferase
MSLRDFIGSGIASAGNRVHDQLLERRLNIQTRGEQAVDHADSVPYSTFAYATIFQVLDRLQLSPEDVLADVGCGKGRVTCAAALRTLRKVIGIDVDANLCDHARGNAQRMRGRRSPVEIACLPAQEFDYRECTALLLFNPFNFGTLRAVLDAVVHSQQINPRAVRLAYVNPRCEDVLREMPTFRQYDHWPLRPRSRLKFAVSFWRSEPVTDKEGLAAHSSDQR